MLYCLPFGNCCLLFVVRFVFWLGAKRRARAAAALPAADISCLACFSLGAGTGGAVLRVVVVAAVAAASGDFSSLACFSLGAGTTGAVFRVVVVVATGAATRSGDSQRFSAPANLDPNERELRHAPPLLTDP